MKKRVFIGILALASLVTSGVWFAIGHMFISWLFYAMGHALVLYLAYCYVEGE